MKSIRTRSILSIHKEPEPHQTRLRVCSYGWSNLGKPANLVKQFFQDCFTINAQ